MKPTIGRIVIYKLNFDDAGEINRRRTNSKSVRERIGRERWPEGAQAHIGAEALVGEEFPMVIVRVNNPADVNGQVLLDGNDTLWVKYVKEGPDVGAWHWPERV